MFETQGRTRNLTRDLPKKGSAFILSSDHWTTGVKFQHQQNQACNPVTHVSHCQWLWPGWIPKIASRMVSLVHIPQNQVRSMAARCYFCTTGGPTYYCHLRTHVMHSSQAPVTASVCGIKVLQAIQIYPMSTCSSTCNGALPDESYALRELLQL